VNYIRGVPAALANWSPVVWRGFPSSRVGSAIRGVFEVIRATDKSPNKPVDVTKRVKALISNGRLSFRVDNETMGGDPEYGVPKSLVIYYRYGDQKIESTFDEGSRVELPQQY
jgi:hypothetical protein